MRAWLSLATARALLVGNGRMRDPAEVARARTAVERVEQLAPGSPDALNARAGFTRVVVGDYDAARVLFERGARLAPSDARFAGNLGYMLVQNLGRPQEAIAHLERGQMLDPRNPVPALLRAEALSSVGRLAEARAAADRALELAPGTAIAVASRLQVELVTGDTAEVHRRLKRLAPTVTEGRDIIEIASFAGWLLDDSASARVLALDADAAGMDRGEWARNRALFLFYRDDTLGARAWGDTARRLLAREAQAPSAGAPVLADLASAEALAGRESAAIAAAARAVSALRRGILGRGSVYHSYLGVLSGVAAMAGASDSAFAWLTEILRQPSTLSGARVAVDPMFARLRDDPRFPAFVAGWGK